MDVVVVEHVEKTYRMGVGRARVREMVPAPVDRGIQRLFPRWWAQDTFNALNDISLAIPAGSSVGIVGHNGAGKTTLLKVIAGVTAPSSGRVIVSGRIAALIDVVVGFHPDLTGRENIFLLGAIHGVRRRVMASRVDQILAFAEIDELADTPLKRFSAGMIARLGFASVTALDVEALLVDEVLAVGDAAFQRKCVQWLDGYRARGGTLVFVSHNLGLVRNMTERVIWLDHGDVAADGRTADILAQYARAMERRDGQSLAHGTAGAARRLMRSRGLHRWGTGGARVEQVHVAELSAGSEALEVTINYQVQTLDEAVFCIGFLDEHGRELGAAASPRVSVREAQGTIQCVIRPLPFRTGIYFPVVAILSSDGKVHDRWQLDRAIVVERNGGPASPDDFGPFDIPASWNGESPSARNRKS